MSGFTNKVLVMRYCAGRSSFEYRSLRTEHVNAESLRYDRKVRV